MRGYRTRYKRPPGWQPRLTCEREGHAWPLSAIEGWPGEHECSRCHLTKVITRIHRWSDQIMRRCTKPEAHDYDGGELLECGDARHWPDDSPARRAPGAGAPIGRTAFGVTVWQVAGRKNQHLAWGGPGDHLRLHEGSAHIDGHLFLGRARSTVSEARYYTLADAQEGADAYMRKDVTT